MIQRTLGNGLRVVVVPQPSLHRVAIGLFVGVGSRFESERNNGISHFLEHMLYRGTARHPSAHAQNHAFETLGGNLHAATHADHTHVSVVVPPASLAPVLELLSELIDAPRLGEIDVERRIVREEILERLDEDGRHIDADDVVRMAMFGDHPLGYTITGPLEALDRFRPRALRAHLERYYVAPNSVLCIAGAVDADHAMALAAKYLGPMRSGEVARATPYVRPKRVVRRRHVASPGSQTDLRLSFLTPGEKSEHADAIELLMRVIDDGMSTRLYRRLCDDGGMVYDCSAAWEPFVECGALDITAEVNHERLPEVVSACLSLTRELADEGPTQQEVDKARQRHRWGVEAILDDAEELCSMVGGAVFFDRPISPDAQAARFDRLSAEHLRDAARLVFRREHLHVVTVGTLTARSREAVREALLGY